MSDRVLVVEDEPAIADAVEFALVQDGFRVDVAADGEAALGRDPDDYDVILLDLLLPRVAGLEVCRRIRRRSTVPIVMLTARTTETDRVLGLEVGADDYVGKPFSTPELLARVRAIVRRRRFDRQGGPATLQVGALRLDLGDQSVTVDGREVLLTPTEFRLLALLASDPGRAFSRRELVRHVARNHHLGERRSCDAHVKNLRRKIEVDPARPRRLVSVRGVGYLLRAGSGD